MHSSTGSRTDPTLDCQQCGDPVRTLSPAEQQQVAADPYAFIVYCGSCRRGGIAADPNLVEGGVIRAATGTRIGGAVR